MFQKYIQLLLLSFVTVISVSSAKAAPKIQCPQAVTSAVIEKIVFSQSAYGPQDESNATDLFEFPARVMNCTADGKFLIISNRGLIWASGAYFSSDLSALKDVGQESQFVSGATRGHSPHEANED